MKVVIAITLLGLTAWTQAQQNGQSQRTTTTTPVPILRQVNKVNEDGSYTYGYENADGSYKIETKDTQGQVQGKYGYYDDTGLLREIEYGASRAGFQPQGTGINAPESAVYKDDINAPTDGSYDPNIYTLPYAYDNEIAQQSGSVAQLPPTTRRIKSEKRTNSAARQLGLFQQQPQQQYQQQTQQYQQQQPELPRPPQQPQQQQYQQQTQQYQQSQPELPRPPQQEQYQQKPQEQYQQPQQRQYQPAAPQQQPFSIAQSFQGHPARNININTGSYSLSY